jgi:tetratricopeptide (TPR) repeat protein
MKTKILAVFFIGGLSLAPRLSGSFSVQSSSGQEASVSGSLATSVQAAKTELRTGVNAHSLECYQKARDMFLNILLGAKAGNPVLEYYVALADYRLASFYLSSEKMTDAEQPVAEGQQYLERAMKEDPDFGEAYALYGFLLGIELALHPDQAMTLGMESFQYMAQAEEKEPANPRVHLIKGVYMLYVPQEYGGGPDSALGSLEEAESLFAKESVTDPLKIDWGKDEVYLYLGLVFKQKNETAKAKDMLKKALAVNPEFGWARSELAALNKF